MMKNLPAKLLVLAVMATLITTTLVSGTFAKYVKGITAEDTVRVAKFAFNLTDGTTAFADQSASSTVAVDVFKTTDAGLYDDGDEGTFIAPGTAGSFTLEVENLSEVDVTASFGLNETNTGSIPVYYTIGAAEQRYSAVLTGAYTGGAGGTYQNLTALATALSGLDLEATDGATATTGSKELHWVWEFNADGTGQSDTTDTALGIDGDAEIILTVATTVTQKD
ncbi:MAG: hypothetical protein RBT41_03605 [Clostridia bacterium]|jgi:hypothetical protein|nr:hypothetical protein [Clostridia bacterium]